VNRWRRFLGLPWAERWLLLQALALLPVAAVVLRWRRLHSWRPVQAVHLRELDQAARHQARAVARLVALAVRRGPYRASCLERSVVLWWLLARQGIRADLRVGVRQGPGQLEAHAWVELAGEVLNDREEVGQLYCAFPQGLRPGNHDTAPS
jgi:hypothetical protein